MMETVLFYLFGSIAVLAAVSVVACRRVFYSALSLILCLCAVSALYMMLESPFVAAVQIIVYAGAIMVLFLFVIMLLDPFSAAIIKDRKKYLGYFSVSLGVITFGLLLRVLRSQGLPQGVGSKDFMSGAGSLTQLGQVLFSDYLLPFEVTSVLILVAIIGVVVLAKRQS